MVWCNSILYANIHIHCHIEEDDSKTYSSYCYNKQDTFQYLSMDGEKEILYATNN